MPGTRLPFRTTRPRTRTGPYERPVPLPPPVLVTYRRSSPEIEDFRVSTLSDKNVRWLNVAMHNALAVVCIHRVCDLYRVVEQQVRREGITSVLAVKEW